MQSGEARLATRVWWRSRQKQKAGEAPLEVFCNEKADRVQADWKRGRDVSRGGEGQKGRLERRSVYLLGGIARLSVHGADGT